MTAETQIQNIVQFMQGEAPDGWSELKLRCRYYDDAMEIKTDYRSGDDQEWISYGGGFTLMDMCEALAEATHPDMDEPWTYFDLSVRADGSHQHAYGYGDPGIFES